MRPLFETKSLFTEWETYPQGTPGDDFDRKLDHFLRPLVQEFADKGFSVRDVLSIAVMCITNICAEVVIMRNTRAITKLARPDKGL